MEHRISMDTVRLLRTLCIFMATRLTNLCTREADVQRQAMRLCGKTVGRDFRLIFPPAASSQETFATTNFFSQTDKLHNNGTQDKDIG